MEKILTPQKWCIVYDDNLEACKMLYSTVSKFAKVSCLHQNNLTLDIVQNTNIIYVGCTKNFDLKNEDKSIINDLKPLTEIIPPQNGYRIKVFKNKYDKTVVILTGDDNINTCYAVLDFENKYLVKLRESGISNAVNYLENVFLKTFTEYDKSFTPYIKRRALWTWGYVIYDYKNYIDNMFKLKLNTLIIWNDYPPINANDIVDYAHKKGISVYWGFSWGWDTACAEADINNLDEISDNVVKQYEKEYANLKGDGIYFQTFTELMCDTINGKVVADAAVSLVNRTAGILLNKYPNLKIQFGLHATSVKNRLSYIKNVDPRIEIIWEDCGAFPFANMPNDTDDFESTLEFSNKIQALRTGGFGEVFKGMSRINWETFTHQTGPFILGEYDTDFCNAKKQENKAVWKYLQAYWISNLDYVIQTVNNLKPDTLVAGLVENGMFDASIWYPVALYAEVLWNPKRSKEEILSDTALIPYVEFA